MLIHRFNRFLFISIVFKIGSVAPKLKKMRSPITKIRFVCLANSNKNNGRCIAGVELDSQNRPKFKDGNLKWVRPISKTQHGEIDVNEVSHINLLDIIEINSVERPLGLTYQSENIYYNQLLLDRNGAFDIRQLADLYTNEGLIFGNKGKAVSEDVIDNLSYSLMLIKTSDFKVGITDGKLRMAFSYNYTRYDLPITDPIFIAANAKRQDLLRNIDTLYLCISLALAHNGWHSKLIAGIIH